MKTLINKEGEGNEEELKRKWKDKDFLGGILKYNRRRRGGAGEDMVVRRPRYIFKIGLPLAVGIPFLY